MLAHKLFLLYPHHLLLHQLPPLCHGVLCLVPHPLCLSLALILVLPHLLLLSLNHPIQGEVNRDNSPQQYPLLVTLAVGEEVCLGLLLAHHLQSNPWFSQESLYWDPLHLFQGYQDPLNHSQFSFVIFMVGLESL